MGDGKMQDVLDADDEQVFVAGIDIDGIVRGKTISRKKFGSAAKHGFGFCSVIFGWDMHDKTYFRELSVSNAANGYRDLLAKVDLASGRRLQDIHAKTFLVSFHDAESQQPIPACPRSLLKRICSFSDARGWTALAGVEYEFVHFRVPASARASSPTPTAYLQHHAPSSLPTSNEGMFGYSVSQLAREKDYSNLWQYCRDFRCPLEAFHPESGPGVYEAALEFCEIREMADRAAMFKHLIKTVFHPSDTAPCFMAKPRQGFPGNSGHIHISLADDNGNLFVRPTRDENAKWPDLAHISDIGRHFLAGVLDGLPDVMPILAPTINSYKRLVENFWAPVTVSWGLEHRSASIRLIAPPLTSAESTRFEIRVPGADSNAHLVLATILALGLHGIEHRTEIPIPPLVKDEQASEKGVRLARTLQEATVAMMRSNSKARTVLGDAFVDHFGGTREHELRVWDEAVTDWYVGLCTYLFLLVESKPPHSDH